MAWPNFEVEVLKQGKLFSTCKQIKTGKIFKIKNEFLYLNNQKYYCLDDYVDYLIPLEKGEVIKLVGIYGPYAYVIKDNEIGSVSYTHLDVYKRQELIFFSKKHIIRKIMKHCIQRDQNMIMLIILKQWIGLWMVELMMSVLGFYLG